MSTELGSFLDWFERRCEEAKAKGFVELDKKLFAHGRHRCGRRPRCSHPVKSDYIEHKDRHVRYWVPVKLSKLKKAA